jgi:hypothetical protein
MCISYECYILHRSRWHVHIWSVLHISAGRIAPYCYRCHHPLPGHSKAVITGRYREGDQNAANRIAERCEQCEQRPGSAPAWHCRATRSQPRHHRRNGLQRQDRPAGVAAEGARPAGMYGRAGWSATPGAPVDKPVQIFSPTYRHPIGGSRAGGTTGTGAKETGYRNEIRGTLNVTNEYVKYSMHDSRRLAMETTPNGGLNN